MYYACSQATLRYSQGFYPPITDIGHAYILITMLVYYAGSAIIARRLLNVTPGTTGKEKPHNLPHP